MNISFIIVVVLQICANVNSQPGTGWNPSWGVSPAPAPAPSWGPTQGTSGNPSWGSPRGSTGSSSWGPPQSSTGGSPRPSQDRCNCGLYETCSWVRNGNAPPHMGCINALENAGGQGTRGPNRDRGASRQQSLYTQRGRSIDTLDRRATSGSGSGGIARRFDQRITGQPSSDFNNNIPGIQGTSRLMETNPGPNNRRGPPQSIDLTTGQGVQGQFNGRHPELGEIVPRPRDIPPIRGGHIVGVGSRDTLRGNTNTGWGASGVRPGRVGSVSGTEHEPNTGIQGRVSDILGDEYGIYYLFYTPGVSTGLRVNITKTGFCSRMPPTRNLQSCVPSCSSDIECSGARKCCPNGCSIGCVAPNQAQPSGSGIGSLDLPAEPKAKAVAVAKGDVWKVTIKSSNKELMWDITEKDGRIAGQLVNYIKRNFFKPTHGHSDTNAHGPQNAPPMQWANVPGYKGMNIAHYRNGRYLRNKQLDPCYLPNFQLFAFKLYKAPTQEGPEAKIVTNIKSIIEECLKQRT